MPASFFGAVLSGLHRVQTPDRIAGSETCGTVTCDRRRLGPVFFKKAKEKKEGPRSSGLRGAARHLFRRRDSSSSSPEQIPEDTPVVSIQL